MAAALARSPPSSQVMDSSSELRSDSSSPDRLTRSLSLSRNGDLQSSSSLRSEEYRQLFRLPSEEDLLQDFNCALQENILIQGHMYLFDHYVCFYSNIFGFETKKIIPFQDVTAVRRAKTAGIFPNAIEVVAAGKKYFFASFLSRDEAFKLINDGWLQQSGGLEGVLDRSDSKNEISSLSNGANPVENTSGIDSPVSELDDDKRNLEVSRLENTKVPLNHVNDNARATALEVPALVENQDAFVDAEPSSSSVSMKWRQESRDAPKMPEGFTKVAESKFPINVERFFNLFFSDDAVGFVESFHKKCGDKDFRCTSWSPLDDFGYVREKTFQHPIKIYFGAKCGGCKETQKVRVYKDRHLIIQTSQEVSDVPYADYFTVEGLWDVQKDGDESEECCLLQVYVNVAFSKKTIWKGKIEQSTMEECREAYSTWMLLAHELLKRKNIEKIEEGATGNAFENGLGDQVNSGQHGVHSVSLHGNADPERISGTIANTWANCEQTGIKEDLLDATIAYRLKAVAVKFCSSLKKYGNLQMFLVIGFSIILLLMQLSIVVLLSRPQQVYVIPQSSRISSTGLGGDQRATDAMHWIQKRMHLLKDEMLVVEAQLERMRHEHILLKAQLHELELLNQQQR